MNNKFWNTAGKITWLVLTIIGMLVALKYILGK